MLAGYLWWELYFKTDIEVSTRCVFIIVITSVISDHSLSFNFLDGLWINHLINGQQNLSSIKKWNLDRGASDCFLQSYLLFVEEVFLKPWISTRNADVFAMWVWWHKHEVNKQVRARPSWLLVAFSLECEVALSIHAWLDFNLLIAYLRLNWLSV